MASIKDGDYYDSSNPLKFHSSELEQSALFEENTEEAKYQLWNEGFKDILVYDIPLSGFAVANAKDRTKTGETFIPPFGSNIARSKYDKYPED